MGRWVVSGNSGNHVVNLFYSDGTPRPNGSVTVSTAGKPAGQFTYVVGCLTATYLKRQDNVDLVLTTGS